MDTNWKMLFLGPWSSIVDDDVGGYPGVPAYPHPLADDGIRAYLTPLSARSGVDIVGSILTSFHIFSSRHFIYERCLSALMF